jgi:hypothetical protein
VAGERAVRRWVVLEAIDPMWIVNAVIFVPLAVAFLYLTFRERPDPEVSNWESSAPVPAQLVAVAMFWVVVCAVGSEALLGEMPRRIERLLEWTAAFAG